MDTTIVFDSELYHENVALGPCAYSWVFLFTVCEKRKLDYQNDAAFVMLPHSKLGSTDLSPENLRR